MLAGYVQIFKIETLDWCAESCCDSAQSWQGNQNVRGQLSLLFIAEFKHIQLNIQLINVVVLLKTLNIYFLF